MVEGSRKIHAQAPDGTMIRKVANGMIGRSALMLRVLAGLAALSTQAAAEKRPPVKISKPTADALADPAKTFPRMSDIVSGNAPFSVTADHIALLRKIRFSRDGAVAVFETTFVWSGSRSSPASVNIFFATHLLQLRSGLLGSGSRGVRERGNADRVRRCPPAVPELNCGSVHKSSTPSFHHKNQLLTYP